MKLSHSFGTVEAIQQISFNERGKYVLCLESRDSSSSAATSVRTYFNWEKDHGDKPLRARIAGLVSPGGSSEPEMQDCLIMVEIPLTSPPTAATSCNLTGHIACLSAESIVNIFLFRAKEAVGRVKTPYYDFDRTYAIEVTGITPERILLVENYLACMSGQKMHVIRFHKDEEHHNHESPVVPQPQKDADSKSSSPCQKVVFDPKDESIRIMLPSIIRANRKRKFPSSTINEEYQEEITLLHSKVVFTAVSPGIRVEDVLRVTAINSGSSHVVKLAEAGMYPVRIRDHLGAVALMVCTQKEGYLYHLPCVPNGGVIRVSRYPFTSPVISFASDSLFFHALTETGLESYTTRALYHATKDIEGIKDFVNDCPLYEEPPSLIGIRPFVNVRKMACNSSVLCMLASPNTVGAKDKDKENSRTSGHDDPNWTIYTLDLPDIEMVYDDIVRTAKLQADTNPQGQLTLLYEGFIALKLFINSYPDMEPVLISRYKEICKHIGLALLKASAINISPPVGSPATDGHNAQTSAANTSHPSESTISFDVADDVVDKGVTYLLMARCTVQEIFSPENWAWIREPRYVPGFVRLVEVTFLNPEEKDMSIENQRISPTLAPVLVEFLSNNGPQTLVELVIQTPFIRECNSKRLILVLQQLAESKNYDVKEVLALSLTLVTVGGVDSNTRSQIKTLYQKTNGCELSKILTKDMLCETRGQQTFLTDLAICLIWADEHIIAEKFIQFLNAKEIHAPAVMHAFAQTLNVNTDSSLQHAITKSLTTIIEKYIAEKLNTKDESLNQFTEDERAIHMLLRTYLSLINFSGNIPSASEHKKSEGTKDGQATTKTDEAKKIPQNSPQHRPQLVHAEQEILQRNQIFGHIYTCVNFLLSVNTPGGYLTPVSQNIASAPVFANEESRENFIKLLSLLSNPLLSNLNGVKDIVTTYLYKNATQAKPTVNMTLYLILQILSESVEKAINLLLSKQPTTIMLFAKETFRKDPAKWKVLVSHLKKRLQESSGNTHDSEMFATILESVYLHLANTLSPIELEQVLDKGTEESSRFHGICKRVELANHYANMVITMSQEYLNQ